jgi:hypothetical protein
MFKYSIQTLVNFILGLIWAGQIYLFFVDICAYPFISDLWLSQVHLYTGGGGGYCTSCSVIKELWVRLSYNNCEYLDIGHTTKSTVD